MKLQDIFEATTLAFTNPKNRFQHQEKKYDLPMATFKTRARVRKAVQTNLVVNYTHRLHEPAKVYYVISDIPPITKAQWRKLIDVSFGEDRDESVDPDNSVRWSISIFPYFSGRENPDARTNEIMNDEQWDKWEEQDDLRYNREQGSTQPGATQPTEIKTMTWKQFVADAIKRFPFKPEHDFSE